MSVTTGRGRNGPWLQNEHLRVESRQDDGSISIVALEGAFRPVERWRASAVLVGGRTIEFGESDYDVQPCSDELGSGRRLTLISRDSRARLTLRREVTLYDAHPFVTTRVSVTNDGGDGVRLQELHVLTNGASGRGRLQAASPPRDWRAYRNGWQSWSPTMSLSGSERDVQSAPPVLSPGPPSTEQGRFTSDDVAVLYDPASGRSLLCGAITARKFITQAAINAPAKALDARNLCDGVAVAPGAAVSSETFLIDLRGHPNEQLEQYGEALGRCMGARVPRKTPTGWCSWYYFFTEVTEDDVVRNLRMLEQHRRALPVDTVQIDDGYQADIGDWLITNEKFPRGMQWLASEIKRAGFTPGLWLAPFLIAETSRTFSEHPDWVVRHEGGEPAVATNNWQRRNFGLDGSHPDARAWLTSLFGEVCDGWGYDYVKIDFLFGAALAGLRSDPNTTRIRAYRAALDAVRAGVGDGRFILGCGSLMAPSVGYFDGNRIGPDVAPFWRNLTSEERARPTVRARTPDDHLSAETAIRNTLTRSFMHGRLWANDPDCVLVREDRTKLTLDEVRTLASVIGLSAGMALVSDDLAKLAPERIDLLSMLIPTLPVSARPVDLLDRDMPERYELDLDTATGQLRLVGLFNFEDHARDLTLPLPGGRWDAFELWEARYLGAIEGEVAFTLVSPHASRVVALRPAVEGPRIVGTNAHIGCGAIDITDVHTDERRLRVGLAPVGRVERRLWVELDGREVASARLDGGELAVKIERGVAVIDVAVERASALELALR